MTADPSLTVQDHDTLAAWLAQHAFSHVNHYGWSVCLCGHVAVGDDDDGSHARHQTAALIASGVVAVRKPLADELRDLADDPEALRTTQTHGTGALRHSLLFLADYVEQQP